MNGSGVYRIATNNTTAAASVRYVTALEVAPSTAAAMSATTHLVSGDGRMEGIMLGDIVALFPKNSTLNPFSGMISYSFTAAASATHYLTGLAPNRSYTVTLDGGTPATVEASAQVSLSSAPRRRGAIRSLSRRTASGDHAPTTVTAPCWAYPGSPHETDYTARCR